MLCATVPHFCGTFCGTSECNILNILRKCIPLSTYPSQDSWLHPVWIQVCNCKDQYFYCTNLHLAHYKIFAGMGLKHMKKIVIYNGIFIDYPGGYMFSCSKCDVFHYITYSFEMFRIMIVYFLELTIYVLKCSKPCQCIFLINPMRTLPFGFLGLGVANGGIKINDPASPGASGSHQGLVKK